MNSYFAKRNSNELRSLFYSEVTEKRFKRQQDGHLKSVIFVPNPPILASNKNGGKTPPAFGSSSTRSKADRERQMQEELGRFSDEIKLQPISDLERDCAEIKFEIELLEKQLTASLKEYSTRDLEIGYAKVALFKKKLELLNMEIAERDE